jgi:hypothetical protein
VGVESSLVVWIAIGREDKRALHVEEGENGGAVDIEQKVETYRDVDSLTFLGREIEAPSLVVGPS